MSIPRYNTTARILHWLTALLIFINLPLGDYVEELKLSPMKLILVNFHKWIGVTVLLLVLARIAWRYIHGAPDLPETMPRWQRYAAHATHAMLYALLIAIPISGWLLSSAKGVPIVYLGLIQLPDLIGFNQVMAEFMKEVHEWLTHMLAFVVVVHIGAALHHHFIKKDDILRRMLPASKNEEE